MNTKILAYVLFFVLIFLSNCAKKPNIIKQISPFVDGSEKLVDAFNKFPNININAQHNVLVLGTFHFNNASDKSSVKGNTEMDVMSEKNQQQIDTLMSILKKFNPTKIAVEWKPSSQKRTDSLFNEYKIGRFKLGRNEVFQLGFRLAKIMNHERVYCVDNFTPLPPTVEKAGNWTKYADSLGHTDLWHAYDVQNELYNSYMDSLKTELNAFELIRLYNTKKYMKRGRQTWVTGLVNLGHGDLYVGADLLGRWHKRNARIYSNIINLEPKAQKERVLVIYGAAHKMVLDELFESNPEYRLTQLEDIIGSNEIKLIQAK